MKKYKINRDQETEVPSKESIAKYKDFTHLSHEYDRLTKRPKVPLYKDKRMFLVLLIILLITYLASQTLEEDSSEENQDEPPTSEQLDPIE
ncbi:hypothetical protein N8987_01610 [Crocinitomix sp.]|nr:hypothetical protein [Crocinitomix sp.]